MNPWPSERVAAGGLFHLPKVKYSKETHDLIKCKFVRIPLKDEFLNDSFHTVLTSRKCWWKSKRCRFSNAVVSKIIWRTACLCRNRIHCVWERPNAVQTLISFDHERQSDVRSMPSKPAEHWTKRGEVEFCPSNRTKAISTAIHFRYRPKPICRLPCEKQKLLLQAKISGVATVDEDDIDVNSLEKAKKAPEPEPIDPIDECKLIFSFSPQKFSD